MLLILFDDEDINKENILKIENKSFTPIFASLETFQSEFINASLVLISSRDDILIAKLISLINALKKEQHIILYLEKSKKNLLVKAVSSKIDEIVFRQHGFDDIYKKIQGYLRNHFLIKELYKIKSFEKKELLFEYERFLIDEKELITTMKSEYLSNIFQNEKVMITEISNSLNSQNVVNSTKKGISLLVLKHVRSLFSNSNFQLRIKDAEKVSEHLLHYVAECKIEDIIFNKLNEIINQISWRHSSFSPGEEAHTLLLIIYEFEKRLMGLNIKYLTQTNLAKKAKELNTDSLHFLMTSISHKQNTFLALIEARSRIVERLVVNNDQRINVIKTVQDRRTMDSFLEFTSKTSSLFCSFKNDNISMNKKNIDFLEFLLELVFVNGNNVKNTKTLLEVKNKLSKQESETKTILLHENILIASLYAVYENAIENKAKNITISISERENKLIISLVDNGEPIEDSNVDKLFIGHYTTKKQLGLGLSIVKKWLNSIGYEIVFSFLLAKNCFSIEIPLIVFENDETRRQQWF